MWIFMYELVRYCLNLNALKNDTQACVSWITCHRSNITNTCIYQIHFICNIIVSSMNSTLKMKLCGMTNLALDMNFTYMNNWLIKRYEMIIIWETEYINLSVFQKLTLLVILKMAGEQQLLKVINNTNLMCLSLSIKAFKNTCLVLLWIISKRNDP